MKIEDFKKMYYSMSIAELCKELDCSATMIYTLLDRHGIERKNNKFRDYTATKPKKARNNIKLEV